MHRLCSGPLVPSHVHRDVYEPATSKSRVVGLDGSNYGSNSNDLPDNLQLRGIRLPRFHTPSSHHDICCLFDTIRTLEFVELTTEGPEFKPKRWYRGAAAPTPIRWLCKPRQEWRSDWAEDVVSVD